MLPEDDPVERTRSVLRVLTGDPNPHDGPVVLVADSRVARPPGMYQIDDLRTAEPVVGALLAHYVDPAPEAERATDEVVVLGEPAPTKRTEPRPSAWAPPRRPSRRRARFRRACTP
jgi:hypothetical protein